MDRITEFKQECVNTIGTCSFVFRGKQYHGKGYRVQGLCGWLYKQKYRWDIYDDNNERIVSFAAYDGETPINRRFVKKLLKAALA